jgi:serine phosphatase RsbU (regulator of sigma subunit)/anti-sigma regulatory factor (Ser/Thr protein kinase)
MLFNRPNSEYFAAFPAAVESLDDIREFVRSALWETPLERKAVAGLLLAVEEAATNVIRHGYLFGPGRVSVRVRHAHGAVHITLIDSGRPYEADWNGHIDPQALAESGRRGGLGIFLMRKVTDRVDYRREGDRNILTLTKYINRPAIIARPRGSRWRKVAWLGSAAVVIVTAMIAFLVYRQAAADVRQSFFGRWTEFARTAAASSVQHILNERSDAEFDQLAVGLTSAYPDLAYLVIVDAAGYIRADAKNPQRVHELYMSPDGVPPEPSGHWPAVVDGEHVFHFAQGILSGRRRVGTVALGMPEPALMGQITDERRRVIIGAALALLIGGIMVGVVFAGIRRPFRKLGEMLQMAKSQGVRLPVTAAPSEVADVLTAVNEVTEAAARSERQTARRDWARRELEQAEQLQRTLLPVHLPEIPGYEADVAYRMANHVGGDYYDVFPLSDDRSLWVLIVADVAGKGFPAALMMMAVRTAVRLLAPGLRNPTDILAALDDYLTAHHSGGPFVTAVCAVLDTRRHTLSIASAGHTPLLHRASAGQTVVRLNPRGRPVGLGLTDAHSVGGYQCHTIELGVGDTVALYTDGLSESHSRSGHAYGLDRLVRVLGECPGAARETVDRILADLNEFTEGAAVEDDITLFVLRRTTPEIVGLTQPTQARAGTDPTDAPDLRGIATSPKCPVEID